MREKSIQIFLKICIFLLNAIYFVLKMLPFNRHKIVFLSRQTDTPSIDFQYLIDEIELQDPDAKVVIICRRTLRRASEFFSKNTFLIFRQMYHLATARVCVVDGFSIPVSVLKHRKKLKVVQIWHSMAAFKKFGCQTQTTKYQKMLAKTIRIHRGYDVLIAPSAATAEHFALAFGYPAEKFAHACLPRVDYLLENKQRNRRKIYHQYPQLKKQRVILYAPTFRDDETDQPDIAQMAANLDKNSSLIVKMHINTEAASDISQYKNVLSCDEYSTLDLLSIADCVITDYSATAIEAMVYDLPIYFYLYDYTKYSHKPGLNLDPVKEYPQAVFKTAKGVMSAINEPNIDRKKYNAFKRKYLEFPPGKHATTKALTKIILEEKYETTN